MVFEKYFNCNSSFDHRVADGFHLAAFGKRTRKILENPFNYFELPVSPELDDELPSKEKRIEGISNFEPRNHES